MKNKILTMVGWFFVGLGFVGAFVPIMPTVPFLLLAAACFSRSSPKLHQWLLSRPKFGPALRDWEENRVIRPRAKALATLLILGGLSYPILFGPIAQWIKWTLAAIGISVIAFILSRNSR